MAEFKTCDDYKSEAHRILSNLNNKDYSYDLASLLAFELLEAYKKGWDDRSIVL